MRVCGQESFSTLQEQLKQQTGGCGLSPRRPEALCVSMNWPLPSSVSCFNQPERPKTAPTSGCRTIPKDTASHCVTPHELTASVHGFEMQLEQSRPGGFDVEPFTNMQLGHAAGTTRPQHEAIIEKISPQKSDEWNTVRSTGLGQQKHSSATPNTGTQRRSKQITPSQESTHKQRDLDVNGSNQTSECHDDDGTFSVSNGFPASTGTSHTCLGDTSHKIHKVRKQQAGKNQARLLKVGDNGAQSAGQQRVYIQQLSSMLEEHLQSFGRDEENCDKLQAIAGLSSKVIFNNCNIPDLALNDIAAVTTQ
jgi:hypothetical protein